MFLLPEWNAFQPGVAMAAIGIVVLLAMLIVRRKMEGKPAVKLNAKTIGTVALEIVGALALGVGMCMTIGMAEPDGSRHCSWCNRSCPAAVPDPALQGFEINLK